MSRIVALLYIVLLVPAAAASADAPARRPHILFLVTDDQRADTVAALGNPAIRTPTLDTLARSGFTFRNAYCLGSNLPAVCQPSRNMYLSGRAYFRWAGPLAPADGPCFPAALRAAGYETYHHGKRGNTAPPLQAKFEHDRYLDETAARLSGEPGKEIVDAAIEFLGRRDASRPFFMYLAFEAPHDPRVAAAPYRALYRPEAIPLPRNFLPLHPFNNGELTIRDERLAPWPRTEDEIRRHLHDYCAVITALDSHIGRLFAALREKNLYDDTLIVFTSDHGLALGSHGLMGKQSLYEDAMKPPLIFAGPGVPKGESRACAYLMDVFPTACEFGKAEVPAGLDGRSLKAVIEGRSGGVRDAVFLAYRDVQRAVRDARWKLIRYPKINRSQLFDLESDPDETRDLAGKPEHAGREEELMERLKTLQREYGDTLALTSDAPEPAEFDFTRVAPTTGKERGAGR